MLNLEETLKIGHAFHDEVDVLISHNISLLLSSSRGLDGAGNSTSTCTALAPESPNDVDAVQTNVQWSTDADLSGVQTAVGYRQVYSQVRC